MKRIFLVPYLCYKCKLSDMLDSLIIRDGAKGSWKLKESIVKLPVLENRIHKVVLHVRVSFSIESSRQN